MAETVPGSKAPCQSKPPKEIGTPATGAPPRSPNHVPWFSSVTWVSPMSACCPLVTCSSFSPKEKAAGAVPKSKGIPAA